MKKTIIYSTLFTTLIFGTATLSLADGMPYEPVFETDPISDTQSATQTNQSVINTATNTFDDTKLQNALIQLDSAQVEIRNNLIQYKNEYSDLDNQYKIIQAQRKAKKQQVKETEKKIKTLENTKERIRKSM